MWKEVIEFYHNNGKLKVELANAGYKVYRICDEHARDILDEVRHSGNLNIKGDNDIETHSANLVKRLSN